MASYNGEKYIAEQIKSIQEQSYHGWKLIIQDDGSTDKTKEIVQQYASIDSRIELYVNEVPYHGAFCNFHSLANRFKDNPEYEYYMFSDQDDIWNSNKIKSFLDCIKEYSEMPCLVYADMSVCSEDGRITNKSMNQIFRMDKRTKYNVFFEHKVFGCNLMMNRALFELVPTLDISKMYIKFLSHDNLYTKFAATFGEIVYLPSKTMSYRRHGDNVTSSVHYKISVRHLLKRVFQLRRLAKDHTIIYNQSLVAISLLRTLQLTEEQKMRLDGIEKCILQGGLRALEYLDEHNIHWRRKSEELSRRVILLTGMYRKYLLAENERF